jgi:hypothetical protein
LRWDVFISHAHEDKEVVVRPLAHLLASYGLEVWFDEFSLRLGDSLRAALDKGLANSRFGVVVLSRSFLEKKWTRFELDSLIQREQPGAKLILPLLFDLEINELRKESPALADKIALRIDAAPETLNNVALKIVREVKPDLYGRLTRRRALLEELEANPGEAIRLKSLGRLVVPESRPVFQEELAADLLSRIRLVRACIKEMDPSSMDDWIRDFRYEPFPDNEIREWEHIAAVYTEVIRAYPLKLAHRRIVYRIVLEVSTFAADEDLEDQIVTLLKRLPGRVRVLLHERMVLRPPFEAWKELVAK